MRQWLMMQDYVALDTTFRKGPDKQVTFRSLTEKWTKEADDTVLMQKEATRYIWRATTDPSLRISDSTLQEKRLAEQNGAKRKSSQKVHGTQDEWKSSTQ